MNKNIPTNAKIDLIIANITLKYTPSNSIVYAYQGQVIGVGAGQQNRIDCVKLAGHKADVWFLRSHIKTLALKYLFKDGLRVHTTLDTRIQKFLSDIFKLFATTCKYFMGIGLMPYIPDQFIRGES